jgi:hypothetical protein
MDGMKLEKLTRQLEAESKAGNQRATKALELVKKALGKKVI